MPFNDAEAHLVAETRYMIERCYGIGDASIKRMERLLAIIDRLACDEGTRAVPICLACGKPAIGLCDATSSIHHRKT